VVLTLLLLIAVLWRFAPIETSAPWRVPFRRLLPGIALAVSLMTLYELLLVGALSRWLRSGWSPPTSVRFANALIETSFPTILLLFVVRMSADRLGAMAGAVSWTYLLFIIFSIMQLNPRLCLFVGVVAATEYTALGLFVLHRVSPLVVNSSLALPIQYIAKGLLLLIAGGMAGFLAHRIRHQFLATVRSVRERDRAVSIIGQHVSPAVAHRLLSQPMENEGEERIVCVMFLDIRDFTRFSEERSPREIMSYLNTLFGFMIDVVNDQGGIVNKFLGDGLMAVFGAPVNEQRVCPRAVATSLEILARVEAMNERGEIPPTRIGIGLNAGTVVTGIVGSAERKEYTVIGDMVNLASRVEKATKRFDARLLVSESVWERLDESVRHGEDLGRVKLRGQSQRVRLHRLA
jgi:adenylate cyclase